MEHEHKPLVSEEEAENNRLGREWIGSFWPKWTTSEVMEMVATGEITQEHIEIANRALSAEVYFGDPNKCGYIALNDCKTCLRVSYDDTRKIAALGEIFKPIDAKDGPFFTGSGFYHGNIKDGEPGIIGSMLWGFKKGLF